MRSRTRSMSRYFTIKFAITTLHFLFLIIHSQPVLGFNPEENKYVPNSRCPANMYGQECYLCDDLTFPADGVCQNCPEGSTSPAGSVYSTNCVCNNGLYRTFKIPQEQLGTTTVLKFECVPPASNLCAANFFRTGGICFPCPAHSTGIIGIETLTDCICNAGYSTSKVIDDPVVLRPYFQCTQCQAGKYAQPFYDKCESCPAASYSLAGSIKSGCVCQGGYSGQNGGSCTGCLPGKYSGGGPMPCVNCPVNSSSLGFASRCLCDKGFTGWDWLTCIPCPAGTYKNTLGSTQCSSCPANKSSPVMSTSTQDCTCSPGLGIFYLDETSKEHVVKCTVCAQGKFKSISGDIPCSNCPANTISPRGSTTITSCVCNAGFSGASGACLSCTAGTYKTLPGNGACTNCNDEEPFIDATRQIQRAQTCQQCAPGTYQNMSSPGALCVNCPVNSTSPVGSQSITNCACKDGFIGDVNNCKQCRTGTYKNTNPPCIDNPGIVRTIEWSKTDWMCVMPDTWQNREGYSTSFVSLSSFGCNSLCNECCAACRAHGLCTQPLAPACTSCPANSIPDLNTCVCNAGFAGPNGWNCTACATGKYSTAGKQFCSCNPGLYGPDGGNCNTCEPGKFSIGAQTVCTLCEVGKYSTTGTTTCSNCPTNSYSSTTGATINECECNPGFSGTGGTCVPCTAGKYKDTLGSTCSTCPDQSTSPTGSLAQIDCVCNAGHTCSDVASFQTNGYYCKYFEKHPGQCLDYAACSSCCSCSLFCAEMGHSLRPFGCESCPVGYNKTSVGPAPCSLCPRGETSTDGLKCVNATVITTKPTLTTSTTQVTTTSTTPAPTIDAFGYVTCSCTSQGVCQTSTGRTSGIISVNSSQYKRYMTCSWIIASKGFISLVFSSFNINTDYVFVSRCTTIYCESSEQIAELTGSGDLQTTFASTTGYMKVSFHTYEGPTSSGFIASWSIKPSAAIVTCDCYNSFCQPSTGRSSGTISINALQYTNSMYCSWIIASNGFISLVFSSFDMEQVVDFVIINRCTSSSCSEVTKVVELTGSGDLHTIFTSGTGYMQMVVQTNRIGTRSGFFSTWNTTVTSTTPVITTSTTPVRTTSSTPSPTSNEFRYVTCWCRSQNICQPSTDRRSGIISVNASQYTNSMYCYWIFASNISLKFSSFDMEERWDFVIINRCTSSSCSEVTKVAELTGSGDLQTTFTSGTGYMEVVINTDTSITRSGFVATWSTTDLAVTSTTPVITTSTTPVGTTSTTRSPTSSTILLQTSSTTPVETTSTTPSPTSSTILLRTSSTTPTQTTSITPTPTTSTTPAITSKSNTITSTPRYTSSMPARTITTTPVSTQTSTPVPSSSSEIFIIIGIITTMLFLICCCLVLFILCSSTRKRQSSLEYEQLEAQKQRANINSSRRRNGDDKVEYK